MALNCGPGRENTAVASSPPYLSLSLCLLHSLSASILSPPSLSLTLFLCGTVSRKAATVRGMEKEMIRSIFLSGNRLPHSASLSPFLLPMPVFCRAPLVWPHHWSIVANFTSKTDKQPYWVCDKLDTHFPYNGRGEHERDRDKESRCCGRERGRDWTSVSQCHE